MSPKSPHSANQARTSLRLDASRDLERLRCALPRRIRARTGGGAFSCSSGADTVVLADEDASSKSGSGSSRSSDAGPRLASRSWDNQATMSPRSAGPRLIGRAGRAGRAGSSLRASRSWSSGGSLEVKRSTAASASFPTVEPSVRKSALRARTISEIIEAGRASPSARRVVVRLGPEGATSPVSMNQAMPATSAASSANVSLRDRTTGLGLRTSSTRAMPSASSVVTKTWLGRIAPMSTPKLRRLRTEEHSDRSSGRTLAHGWGPWEAMNCSRVR